MERQLSKLAVQSRYIVLDNIGQLRNLNGPVIKERLAPRDWLATIRTLRQARQLCSCRCKRLGDCLGASIKFRSLWARLGLHTRFQCSMSSKQAVEFSRAVLHRCRVRRSDACHDGGCASALVSKYRQIPSVAISCAWLAAAECPVC